MPSELIQATQREINSSLIWPPDNTHLLIISSIVSFREINFRMSAWDIPSQVIFLQCFLSSLSARSHLCDTVLRMMTITTLSVWKKKKKKTLFSFEMVGMYVGTEIASK